MLRRAANRIRGGLCSDDGFDCFALWLVAQGRGTHEAVIADPDVLADASEVRALAGRHVREWHDDEWPEWEELDYVAREVFDELTGQDDDCGDAVLRRPGGRPGGVGSTAAWLCSGIGSWERNQMPGALLLRGSLQPGCVATRRG